MGAPTPLQVTKARIADGKDASGNPVTTTQSGGDPNCRSKDGQKCYGSTGPAGEPGPPTPELSDSKMYCENDWEQYGCPDDMVIFVPKVCQQMFKDHWNHQFVMNCIVHSVGVELQHDLTRDEWKQLGSIAWEAFKELSGINNIVGCYQFVTGQGDQNGNPWLDCGVTVLTIIPASKLAKVLGPLVKDGRVTEAEIREGAVALADAEKAGKQALFCRLAAHSFAADTRVLMADGSTKPIANLKPGDHVLATDPTTRTTEARQITATHINQDIDLVDITMANGSGTETVHTTQNHPFWVAATARWTVAGQLKPG